MNWPINVAITCETDKVLFDDIGDMYKFLNWMTGDNLYTHQLPRAMDACRPFLEQQIPWLKDCNREEITKENAHEYLERQIALHGETVDVEPLPEGAWEHKDAIMELLEMMALNGN